MTGPGLFHSFYQEYRRARRRKEESPAALNFARSMLCGAWIEDGYSIAMAFADALVLAL
jgi:hypothetical protein